MGRAWTGTVRAVPVGSMVVRNTVELDGPVTE